MVAAGRGWQAVGGSKGLSIGYNKGIVERKGADSRLNFLVWESFGSRVARR